VSISWTLIFGRKVFNHIFATMPTYENKFVQKLSNNSK
jgi:hypothetical protein